MSCANLHEAAVAVACCTGPLACLNGRRFVITVNDYHLQSVMVCQKLVLLAEKLGLGVGRRRRCLLRWIDSQHNESVAQASSHLVGITAPFPSRCRRARLVARQVNDSTMAHCCRELAFRHENLRLALAYSELRRPSRPLCSNSSTKRQPDSQEGAV